MMALSPATASVSMPTAMRSPWYGIATLVIWRGKVTP